ncbi:response regulator [Clostridium sp. YIM B02515]|uniref:Stage 0 sporulation protein A homolog n=1 Tax=Clostridium rhizosphaerae TaxID=2803861 RepID=A0ABS1TGA4_9CLOT|nr:helix-turn-helix domain-containing protein [Clostridium rhizosphaerae]MBL4937641.1 response regulator [Clostridium rhizosphaerae]
MRLIIVEDDLLTAEVVRDSINWGVFGIHDVQMAHNVTGAQKLFEENIPDIVICDIEMPKGSGLDLLKWVRSNNYKSEFIFLTNHENFQFASTALEYNAISYITKPFNIEKTEMAISKAVDKIRKENHLQQYSEYGQYWLENKKLIVESFWRDILFFNIPPEQTAIAEEITKRKLLLNIDELYHLVLVSVIKFENQGDEPNDQTFEYALKKLSSEVILGELDFEHTIYYVTDRNHYVAVLLADTFSDEQIKDKCAEFIENCKKYLKYAAVCYIGNKTTINALAKNRVKLEEMDQNNFILRNNVLFESDVETLNLKGQYALDTDTLRTMFEKREKIQIVNFLKSELELLVAKNSLDGSTMYSIHQDFMQVVYTFLHKQEIQAHNLFSDKVSQKLNQRADNSVFDMLKWVHFVTTKTIDYAEEVRKSDSIIDKAKKYIQEHYKEEITKNDVAASVFLTPDYLAKMFKAETGVVIKDFINNCRIEKAKELLRNSDASVSMIASEVGFDNFSYFSTIFKKLTGVSPQSFRKEDER